MGLPAARKTDPQECTLLIPKPHNDGTIISGYNSVIIEGQQAARFFDDVVCSGDPGINYIASGAITVFIGRRPAARESDDTFHGGWITSGASTVFIGGPRLRSWTIATMKEIMCDKNYPGRQDFINRLIQNKDQVKVTVMGPDTGYYKYIWNEAEKKWEKKWQPVIGWGGTDASIRCVQDKDSAVNTLYHEWYHVDNRDHQSSITSKQAEYETEKATEQWAIDNGLPEGAPGLRKWNPATNKWEVDDAAIKRLVGLDGPPAQGSTLPPDEKLIEHRSSDNKVQVQHADGTMTWRDPKNGDFYRIKDSENYGNPREINLEWLRCDK